MAVGLFGKLCRSLRQQGVRATFARGMRRAWDRMLEQTPGRRRARRAKEQEDRHFDLEHGVDTGGIVTLDRVDVVGANRAAGVSYWAIGPEDFRRAIATIGVRYEAFTFLDFGSGKGRAVLLASECPFRKIVGIEFSPTLHEAALRNLRTFRSDRQRCRSIELVCMDAADFQIPAEPLVCYFFNPFQEEVMTRVVGNLRRSWAEHHQEMAVVYCNPQLETLWTEAGFLSKAGAVGNCSIFRTSGSKGDRL